MKIKKFIGILFLISLFFSCKRNTIELPKSDYINPILLEQKLEIDKATEILGRAYSYENAYISKSEAELICETIKSQIELYDWLDFYFIISIIEVESEFKKFAKNFNLNQTNDFGYMQINEISLEDYNLKHWKNQITLEEIINDTEKNIIVGCWILDSKRKRLESAGIELSYDNIICAYNCGEGKVKRNNIPQCTINYKNKVMNLMM